jgi:hypothetical protein
MGLQCIICGIITKKVYSVFMQDIVKISVGNIAILVFSLNN